MTSEAYSETRFDGKTFVGEHDLTIVRQCPRLWAYLQRIGARVRNFRRFVVEERDEFAYRGWRTVARLRLEPDGKIVCDNLDLAPTPEEFIDIAEEVRAANFPTSINARTIDALKRDKLAGVSDKDIFVFRDESGQDILFVQQRTYKANGIEKAGDLPWTFWSDAEWRCMEPDGKLPLYGLDRLRKGFAILLHEGASG